MKRVSFAFLYAPTFARGAGDFTGMKEILPEPKQIQVAVVECCNCSFCPI